MTSDLAERVWQHKTKPVAAFTKRYSIDRLVWYELHETMEGAILREKRIKRWRRAWKLALIEAENPQWHDLYDTLI